VNGSFVSPWSQTWSFTTDNSTGVNELRSSVLSVYPNPAAESVIITGVLSTDVVFIRDVHGKIVRTIDVLFDGSLLVDIADLPPALYTVEISGVRNSVTRFVITE
jgi:hypothetical protein